MTRQTDAERKRMISELLPNTFPFPNIIIDAHPNIDRSIWSVLVGAEQNLLTILYRKTFGWWKKTDRISNSQLVEASGLSPATVRKYMTSLCVFGLAIKVSTGKDGFPNEWAAQTDDSKIDFPALIDRRNRIDEVNAKRWEAGRGVLSDRRGTVGQNTSPSVGQKPSPSVGQNTQKPLSKTKTKTTSSAMRRASKSEMPKFFPKNVQELAHVFVEKSGLTCDDMPTFTFWVYGNSKSRAKGFDHMRKTGITPDDLQRAFDYVQDHNRRNPNNRIMVKSPNSIFTFAHELMKQRTEKQGDDFMEQLEAKRKRLQQEVAGGYS